MYLFGKISVTAVIPSEVIMLKDMSYNLWWTWNSDCIDLYREIDLDLWEKLNKNPVNFLQEVSQKKIEEKIKDSKYMDKYNNVVNNYNSYLNEKKTYFNLKHSDKNLHHIAYFSAEYGLNEVLPVYSGGLGVLSGDHCKAASDLGLPFTAIGLFYKQGYFSQHINKDGWQETNFSDLNTNKLPITPALNKNGEEVYINVEMPGRLIYAKIWHVKIGRINLYLMDTDVSQNNSNDRSLTARLYGGDHETRIQQEILLGIGGIKTLEALSINATVFHMNEGHSAFMGLELIKKLIKEKNITFKEAKEVVAASSVFTTHTPVPAGNDVFPLPMIDKYFSSYWSNLGINRHEFLALGLRVSDQQNFNMTVLALTLSGRKNGVSELHGAVSRNIFKDAWLGVPEEEIPIGHITNGIHTLTWLSPGIKEIYDKYLGDKWHEKMEQKEMWDRIDDIPDEELWKTHCVLKTKMLSFVREKIRKQRLANGETSERINDTESLFEDNALTIGFARRFATYKRADLIFRNIVRIQKILNNTNMPVQIIFAGKAHPADRPAHEIIKNLNDIAQQEGFVGKVVVVENYNMTVSRNLVQGVDVWLNNPRRPLEASGTSGQKVCINGNLNFSVLDGWWCEGFNGKNGWSIGDETAYENENSQDNADSESIYQTLENQIVPLFYNRNENNVPVKWVKMMKENIKSLTYEYSTYRMVSDYFTKMYGPCMERMDIIKNSSFTFVKKLADWKTSFEKNWSNIQFINDKTSQSDRNPHSVAGETVRITTNVYLGPIEPKDIKVEFYYGDVNYQQKIENASFVPMTLGEVYDSATYEYYVDVKLSEGGEYGYNFRIIPEHVELINRYDLKLIKWSV